MVDYWRKSLDIGESVIAVFIDLFKAFDTVNHELLLFKLRLYNFSDSSTNLIDNYLTNRSVFTKFGSFLSKKLVLTNSGPQIGSKSHRFKILFPKVLF